MVFDYAIAGLGTRFMAFALDALLSAVLVLVGLLLVAAAQGATLGGTRAGFGQGAAAFVGLVVVFAAQWGYYVVSEWAMGGQTLGKRVFGLRVVTEHGLRLRLSASVVRNLLRLVDAFPIAAVVAGAHPALHLLPLFVLPGAAVAWLSVRNQRLGDLAAGTMVVVDHTRLADARQGAPFSSALPGRGSPHNRFRGDAAVRATLRRHLHPEAVDLLVTLCARRDTLLLGPRLELFHDAALRLERATSIPKHAEQSDEKYVLGLVELLLTND